MICGFFTLSGHVRSSMEQEKLHFVHKEGFIFAGAIFMSNRATKLECLRRKLFGLPESKAKFLEQVKSGMILFLFEHEERKLYGVFEATSDGALNIIPDAFRSTGQSYPAQICCKRILMCRPLCEDEFRGAIKENYYSPNKFHFGLSYDQVTNLIQLFYLKKINLKQHEKKPVLPNKIIERLENSAAEKDRLTEAGSSVKSEYSRERKQDVRRKYTPPRDLPMHYNVTDTGRGSNHVTLRTLVPPPSYSQYPYSKPDDSSHSFLFVPDDHPAFHHFSTGQQCSTTEVMDSNKPSPRESDRYMAKFDSVAVPYSMGQHHHSSPDVAAARVLLSCDDMIPRQIKFQEPHIIESLRVVNDDHHQTVVLQHAPVCGAQPHQLFEFPDFIPLPEDLQQNFVEENQNSGGGNFECVSSAAFRSCIPSTCKEISEAFYTDDDDMNSYRRLVSDDYPAVRRASVFSRLSRGQNIREYKTPESPTSSPLDQLLDIPDSRREWQSTTETSKQLGKWGSGDQYDRTVLTKLVDRSGGFKDKFAVQPVERSMDDQYEPIADMKNVVSDASLDYVQVDELSDKESFELPFCNFRRRNMSQKLELQDDSNTCSKRRRILRPSLYGEEQNAKCAAEVKMSSQTKEETKVKILASTISEDENENKNKANCLKSERDGELVLSFIYPETEAKAPTQANREHETKSHVPGFQTHQESEMEGQSVSSFICTETEVKAPAQAISEHAAESIGRSFRTPQISEMEEPVSFLIRTETEGKAPTQAISEHETESKVPGFQTRQKSEMEGESVSSFMRAETEVKAPTQAISEHETESKVRIFRTYQISKMEDKSVEANYATFVHESEDYIPLD